MEIWGVMDRMMGSTDMAREKGWTGEQEKG